MKRFLWPVIAVLALILCGGLLTNGLRQARLSVERVSAPSPALRSAIERAQRELPRFRRELAVPRDRRFFLRASFATRAGREYLWLRNLEALDGGFRGTIDQPSMDGTHRRGKSAFVKESEVVDWAIRAPDGTRTCCFTEDVLSPRE